MNAVEDGFRNEAEFAIQKSELGTYMEEYQKERALKR
jgi:hypothetical protein